MANNPKHTFDFEAIINTKINQSNWRENKRKLQDAFGDIKVGIEGGMAKEEAQKVVDILNKGFEKASMPKIDVSDFMNQIDEIAEKFTKALGLINNIDTSALKGIEASLEHISDVIDKIEPKVGKGVSQAVKNAVASVGRLDDVLGKVEDSAERAGEALNFAVDGDAKKQSAALKKIKAEYDVLEQERAALKKGETEDSQHWLKRQEAMVKFVRTYEAYASSVKNKKDIKGEYANLYNTLLPKSHDAKTNLQNLIDRKAGTFSSFPEPWAKEKTLEEVRDILKGGLSVKAEISSDSAHSSADNDGKAGKNKSHGKVEGNDGPWAREETLKKVQGVLENGAPVKSKNAAKKETIGGNKQNEALSSLANRIVAAIDEAKSKRSLDWESGTTTSVRTELISKAIKSNFLFAEGASEDDIEDLINNAVSFSVGDMGIQEIVDIFKPIVVSLEDIYNNAPKDIQELIQRYVEFDDVNSDKEAYDVADQISDKDSKLGSLIANAVEVPEYWAKFRDKIKSKAPSVPTGMKEVSGVDAGALTDISNKMDSLAKDTSISAAKDAIVSAIGSGGGQVDLAPGAADALVGALKNINISHSTEVPEVDTTSEQEQFKSLGGAIDVVTASINAKTQAFQNEETVAKTAVENEIAVLNELEAKLAAIKVEIGTLFVDAKLDEAGSIGQYIEKFKGLSTEISSVKKTFKELSKVIGQKNAGFIKGQKAVNAALEAERQTVESLIDHVGTGVNSIIQDLTKLRMEFEKPLTFPEMNKANLNSVFDEIYRKFTDLMERVSSSGFNFDINTESIAAAIKEAIYAGDIAAGEFKHITDFDQTFEKWMNWRGEKEFRNRFTGEVFSSEERAKNEFEAFWKDRWTNIGNKNTKEDFLGTEENLLARIESDKDQRVEAINDKLAQVIVQAITTQTGEIIEAIKLIIPQDVAESNGPELAQAFDTFINWVSEWSRNEWTKPGALFQKMLNGYLPNDKDVLASLKTLGLISENNVPKFVLPGSGVRNLGVAVGDTSVVSTQNRGNVDDPAALMEKLNKANDMGAAVPRILGMNESTIGHNGRRSNAVFFLQTLASGQNVTDYNTHEVNKDSGFLGATPEQIDGLLHTFEKIQEVGLYADLIGDNVLFDQDKGFSVIDLNTDSEGGIGTNDADDMLSQFLSKISWARNLSLDQKDAFIKKVDERRALPPEQRLVNDKVIAERIKQQEEAAKQAETKDETPNAEGGLDKGSLEEVLTSVFKNILNPQTQPSDERAEEAPFALEATLKQVKDILGRIGSDTSKLSSGEIKIIPVDDTSETGTAKSGATSDMSEDSNSSKVDKRIDKLTPDGKIIHRVEINAHNTEGAFQVDKVHLAPDQDGNLQVEMIEIIKDFDKIRKEEKKNAQAVARAQKKVNEFVAKFESKTGGNAKFVEGFSELSGFTVNEKNIDEAYNKMIELQRNYAQLETNFRKGQSSLNPFVNAMNRAQNIDNIFGEIDNKFNGLTYKSEELVDTFGQLETLSKEIHDFVARMNDPNAEPITPADFTKFSEQMGEFIATKVKFDGIVRSDKDKNREAEIHNAQVETELIKGLVKLYEQLGKAQAMGNAEEASRLRGVIRAERDKLLSVDYATDMRFKAAKEKGRIDAENAALREQAEAIKKLNKLYFEYGELKEAAALAGDSNIGKQLATEAEEKLKEINVARGMLGEISPDLEAQFADSIKVGGKKGRNNQLRAAAKKADADEASRLKKIAKLEKEIGGLRAESETVTDGGVKEALEEEIQIREQLIEIQKEGLALDAESEAYFKQVAANQTREAKKAVTERLREEKKLAKVALANDKKLKKRQAMTGKAGNAIGRAENVWLEAEGLDRAKLPKKFQAEIEEYYNKIDLLRIKQHELNTSDVITTKQRNQLMGQTREVNKLTEKIGGLVSEYQRLSGENVKEMDVQNTLTAKSGIDDYERALKSAVATHTNGKAQIKAFNAETKTLTYTVKTGAHEFTEYTAAVRHLDKQFVAVQGSTKRTETFLEATKRKMYELSSYMSGMSLFSRASQEIRKGIQYIREIDLALTELRKVTDETEEAYDKFLKTAAKTGARLGTTISAVTEATATFAKLGYSMEQATEMAEAAIVYKNVGDNIASTEDAADSIISTLKGFGMEASEAMAIVDRFNEVGE